jgi:hypothetical protein
MSSDSTGTGRAWVGAAALAGLALALAVAPFRPVFHLYPTGDDSIFWTWFMDPHRAGWWRSALLEPHFIAYRPVTALTFALNGALGTVPWQLHAVDVLQHVLAGFALAGVWAALGGGRATSPGAVASAAVFWATPLAEAVVPYVARRSYSLATALGLAALVLVLTGVRSSDRRREGAGVAVLLLALLSNEITFVLVPVLAAAALASAPTPRAGAPVAGLVTLAAGLVAAARAVVLRGVGGYDLPWAATVQGGERVLLHDADRGAVFGWAWRAGVLPDTPSGDPSFLLASPLAPWLVAGLAAWAVGWSVERAVRARDGVPLLLGAWALGYTVLPVVTDTWFPRMAYPMGAPVALWLAWMTRTAVRAGGWVHLAPLALVLAARLQQATVVQGLDRKMLRELFVSTRLVRQVRSGLATVEAPAVVWVGMNVEWPIADASSHWIRLEAPLGVEVRRLTNLAVDEHPSLTTTVVSNDPFLRPAAGAVWSEELIEHAHTGPRGPIPLRLLAIDDRPAWVLDDGTWISVPPRDAASPEPP